MVVLVLVLDTRITNLMKVHSIIIKKNPNPSLKISLLPFHPKKYVNKKLVVIEKYLHG